MIDAYRKEIDGLRAFAVIPVLLFHAGFDSFSGGFIGVDIFFVISGFLITSILLKDLENEKFSLISFYERRARRILPALFFMVFTITPLSFFYLYPDELQKFGMSLISTSLFISNIYFSLTTGYFDNDAELNPLIHTWSLSVEEQYYLLFPLFLFALYKNKNYLVSGLVIVSLVSFAFTSFGDVFLTSWPFLQLQGLSNISQSFLGTFYMPFGRMWELLAGSIAAIIFRSRDISNSRLSNIFSYFGFLLLITGFIFFDRSTLFPSIFTLVPVMGTVLIIIFVNKTSLLYKILSFKALTYTGLISYSLYLWHQPILVFYKSISEQVTFIGIILCIILSFFIAYFSWRFIEAPFRNKERINTRTIFTLSGASIIFSCFIGSYIYLSDGFSQRYENRLTPSSKFLYNQIQEFKSSNYWIDSLQNVNSCKNLQENIDNKFQANFLECAKKHGKAIVIIGDSHAVDIFNSISINTDENDFIIGLTQSGCRLFHENNSCFFGKIREFIIDNSKNIKLVIFNQAGNYLFTEEKLIGQMNMFNTTISRNFTVDQSAINSTISYLVPISEKIQTVYLGPYIEPYLNHYYFLNKSRIKTKEILSKNIISNFSTLDKYHIELFASNYLKENPNLTYISSMKVFDQYQNFIFLDLDSNLYMYSDSDHLSNHGEKFYGKYLVNSLLK